MAQQLGMDGNLAGDEGVSGGEATADQELPLGLDVEALLGADLVLDVGGEEVRTTGRPAQTRLQRRVRPRHHMLPGVISSR
jgi:hypothetical protein